VVWAAAVTGPSRAVQAAAKGMAAAATMAVASERVETGTKVQVTAEALAAGQRARRAEKPGAAVVVTLAAVVQY
jgi:hypothetical protein